MLKGKGKNMENSKKILLMKIHAVLLMIGFVESIRELIILVTANNLGYENYLIDFSNSASTYNLLVIIDEILVIVAFAFSLIYMLKEYRKSAHISYKIFLCIYLAIWTLETISAFVFADAPTVNKVITIAQLIVLAILAFAKNLGKKNSKSLATILIVLTICIMIALFYDFINKGYSLSPIIVNVISGYLLFVLLSTTAYIMVTGKYIDKESRGAK